MTVYLCFVAVSLMTSIEVTSSSATDETVCPLECNCTTNGGGSLNALCVTERPQATIDHLPTKTRHLKVLLAPNVKFFDVITFGNMPELRILELDTMQKYTTTHNVMVSDVTFYNNTHLEVFRSRVLLTWAKYDVFTKSPYLTEILLSNTKSGWSGFQRVCKESLSDKKKLTKLHLKSFCEQGLSEWKVRGMFRITGIFGLMNASKIRDLDLSSNGLHFITSDWFGGLRYLERLDISYNMLCYPSQANKLMAFQFVATLSLLKTLRTFILGHQGVYGPYKTSADDQNGKLVMEDEVQLSTPLTNDLEDLNEDKCIGSIVTVPIGNITAFIAPAVLPSTYPSTSGALQSHRLTCYAFSEPNNLEFVEMQDNAVFGFLLLKSWSHVVFLNLNKLHTINLQRVGASAFHETFFSEFQSLEVALLSGNMLSASIEKRSYFANNAKLRVLDLANNGITNFPDDFFHGMPLLTHLNVSGNKIFTWDSDLTILPNLVVLNFSGNLFSNLSESFRSQLEILSDGQGNDSVSMPQKHFVVDLQDNPLSCLCGDISAVRWFQRTKIELYCEETYTCSHPVHGPYDLMKVDVNELKRYCFPDMKQVYILSVVTSCLVTLLVVMIVTLYCKRWHIRYWLYLLRKGWKKYQQDSDATEYEYDVFVAHSTEDEAWVTGPLYDELEVKRGLRLCLYQRDILPNEILVEAIVDRIDKSRHTLLVLSPNFVASNWCHFEMHIAHAKWSEEGKDMIFPVILKPLSPFSVNRTLHYLLKRKVYLEWPNDPCMQQLFWQRLASSLGSSVQGSHPPNNANPTFDMCNSNAEVEPLLMLEN